MTWRRYLPTPCSQMDWAGPRPFIQRSQGGELILRLNFATNPLQMCVGFSTFSLSWWFLLRQWVCGSWWTGAFVKHLGKSRVNWRLEWQVTVTFPQPGLDLTELTYTLAYFSRAKVCMSYHIFNLLLKWKPMSCQQPGVLFLWNPTSPGLTVHPLRYTIQRWSLKTVFWTAQPSL